MKLKCEGLLLGIISSSGWHMTGWSGVDRLTLSWCERVVVKDHNPVGLTEAEDWILEVRWAVGLGVFWWTTLDVRDGLTFSNSVSCLLVKLVRPLLLSRLLAPMSRVLLTWWPRARGLPPPVTCSPVPKLCRGKSPVGLGLGASTDRTPDIK